MWLIFLIPSLIISAQAMPPAESGPRYESEARITWEKAHQRKAQGLLKESCWLFRRITGRYPAFQYFEKAHFELGICESQRGNYQKAIAPLRFFIESREFSRSGLEARIPLGEAFLAINQYHEGLMVAEEMLLNGEKKTTLLDAPLRVEALLLKTQALLKLDRMDRAKITLNETLTLLKKLDSEKVNRSSIQSKSNPSIHKI